ncbi:dihydrofolate reductase family protein [Cryptosporangium minutisporangium]|uniref:Dihydrofolate reductase family protein n=1 Tax=Cryptosporangium minutisporangium TaxID=113569 RepID=A0ABP6TA50_9ACTN
MTKLILQTQVSLDGYMGAPDGDLEWLLWHWQQEWPWDPQLRAYHEQLLSSCRVALLSGKMAVGPGFLDHWHEVAQQKGNPQQRFAQSIVDADKVAFSRSGGGDIGWPNTRYATRPLSEEVHALKRAAKTDLIAWGGSEFVQSLLREDLVDEVHLLVNPTALGDGLPVFPADGKRRTYHLVHATAYSCGVTVQRYAVRS